MEKVPNLDDIPDYSEPWCDNSKPVEPDVIVVNVDVDDER